MSARDAHRMNIHAVADALTLELSEADHIDYLNEEVLEVDHMCSPSDPDRFRTRFLLTCGGPHVEVVVDSRDGVSLFHSWGKANNRANAKDLREVDLRGTDAAAWEALAETYRETMG